MTAEKTCGQCGALVLDADLHNRWHRDQNQRPAQRRALCKRCKGTGRQPGLYNDCGRCWGSGVE